MYGVAEVLIRAVQTVYSSNPGGTLTEINLSSPNDCNTPQPIANLLINLRAVVVCSPGGGRSTFLVENERFAVDLFIAYRRCRRVVHGSLFLDPTRPDPPER